MIFHLVVVSPAALILKVLDDTRRHESRDLSTQASVLSSTDCYVQNGGNCGELCYSEAGGVAD